MRPTRAITSIASLALGVVVAGCAAWAVFKNSSVFGAAGTAISGAPVWLAALLPLLVVPAIALSAGTMRCTTALWDRIRFSEMLMLVASCTLVNYLPLRPSLAGRAAYLHIKHKIPLQRTVLVLMVLSGVTLVVALLGGITVAGDVYLGIPWWTNALLMCTSLGLLGALSPNKKVAILARATLWRMSEVANSALRLYVCFRLIGSPIDMRAALAGGIVSVLAGIIPLVPSGLGIREWGVGLVGPALHAYTLDVGLAADLLNRAADLVVIVPWGTWATARAARSISSRHGPKPVS